MAVARVLRVHRKAAVARNRLGSRRRNLQPCARLLHHLHFEIIKLALLLLHDDLLVREGGQRFRAPIHHPFAAINEPLFIQVHEHPLHASRVILIHRESQPRPVTARAELFQLLDDDAAVLLFPFPNVLEQLLASEIIAMLHSAFLAQLALHHILRRDARMIRPRQPKHLLAIHPRLARQNVLNSVVEDVPHVEHSCDIRRRNYNRICRPRIAHPRRVCRERLLFQPGRVPLRLNCARFICLRNLCHRSIFSTTETQCCPTTPAGWPQ